METHGLGKKGLSAQMLHTHGSYVLVGGLFGLEQQFAFGEQGSLERRLCGAGRLHASWEASPHGAKRSRCSTGEFDIGKANIRRSQAQCISSTIRKHSGELCARNLMSSLDAVMGGKSHMCTFPYHF